MSHEWAGGPRKRPVPAVDLRRAVVALGHQPDEARRGLELVVEVLDLAGASVAKVAMAHGINANILRGWRKLARRTEPAFAQQEFIPVAVAPAVQVHSDERGIELELRRGTVTIKLLWPMNATAELAAFTRGLLR